MFLAILVFKFLAKKTRYETFERWLKANFTRVQLKAIASHGAIGGRTGMIYYTETAKLYAKFKEEIWERIVDESQQSGYCNPFAYLAELPTADTIDDVATLENWLVWYTAENMAYCLTENKKFF